MTENYYRDLLLKSNRFQKDLHKLKVFKSRDFEGKMYVLESIADFNCQVHSGRFTSVEIDNKIKRISDELKFDNTKREFKLSNVRLHIASYLHDTGGHTRLLENIAQFEIEKGNRNILVVTKQTRNELPNRIINNKAFEKILCFGTYSYNQQIELLLQESFRSSLVYNHQHPQDIVPSIILNDKSRPYTIYVNHADHIFWAGAAFSDCILNIRPFAKNLTLERRNSEATNIILPVKLDLSKKRINKQEAKQLLGVDESSIVLLTISNVQKVLPDRKHNFFNTIKSILSRHKNTIYFFVGVSTDEYKSIMREEVPERLFLKGLVEDPTLYQSAADFYLEGMPYNSLTALLESINMGVFPVLMWGPYYINCNLESEFYINSIVKHSANENEYHDYIDYLIINKDRLKLQEKINEIQANIYTYNSFGYWDETLSCISKEKSSNNSSIEFAMDTLDLRLVEIRESQWEFIKVNAYYSYIHRIAQNLSSSEIFKLWFKYLFTERKLNLRQKLMLLKEIVYKRYISS